MITRRTFDTPLPDRMKGLPVDSRGFPVRSRPSAPARSFPRAMRRTAPRLNAPPLNSTHQPDADHEVAL
jgi:hypothetical protein